MAFHQPSKAHNGAPEGPKAIHRLKHVLGAGWIETAPGGHPTGYQDLVGPDKPPYQVLQYLAYSRFHAIYSLFVTTKLLDVFFYLLKTGL
jgi:hypothetical protein